MSNNNYIFPTNVIFEDSKINKQEIFYNEKLYKFFKLHELFSEVLLDNYKEKCLQFVDYYNLLTLYNIRTFFNKQVTVNNWKANGSFSNRLVRFPNCKEYSAGSAHSVIIDKNGIITKRCQACDLDISGISAKEARNTIIANKDTEYFKYINRMENNVNWLHYDSYKVKNRIYLFNV